MKKIAGIAVVVCVFFTAGCTTELGAYDVTLSLDQQCRLVIDDFAVVGFNGEFVNWSIGFFASKAVIDIPPGTHMLTVRVTTTRKWGGITEVVSTDHMVEYKFEAGHSYRLYEKGFIFTEIAIEQTE